MPVKPISIAACLLMSLGAREALGSCAASNPYAFPAEGKVLPNPTLYAENVVRVVDERGVDLPFVQVPYGVKIVAPERTSFTLETVQGPRGSKNKFGPYRVIGQDPSEVPPPVVGQIYRYSHGSPDPVQAVVLTVPTAADAYQIEVQDLPDGIPQTLIVPGRRGQYWGEPPEVPAYLDIGYIDCRKNYVWVAPKVRVRVAALRTDGKMSAYSAPIIIRAPIPTNSHFFPRTIDLLLDQPVPFAAAATALVSMLAFWILRMRSRWGRP